MSFLSILVFAKTALAFTLSCPSTTTECEGWAAETLSIELNASNCPSTITSEVQEALDLWNSISTSGLKLEIGAANNDTPATIVARVSNGTPHNMVIACDTAFQTTLGFSADEANAIPGVANSNTVASNAIDVGYVLLNVQSGANANINNLSAELRKVIIAHEVGHALGLGHSETDKALMFFDATAKQKMSLHQDDIDGISYLYPREEPSDSILGCGLINPGSTPPSAPPMTVVLLLLLPLIVALHQRLTLSQS